MSDLENEIQQRITRYLDAIESSAQGAGEFVFEQTPMLAQEYLAWSFWCAVITSVTLLVAGCIVIAVSYVFVRRTLASSKSFEEYPEVMLVVFPVMLSIVAIGLSIESASRAVKVKVAPRVVLMEKVLELSR